MLEGDSSGRPVSHPGSVRDIEISDDGGWCLKIGGKQVSLPIAPRSKKLHDSPPNFAPEKIHLTSEGGRGSAATYHEVRDKLKPL